MEGRARTREKGSEIIKESETMENAIVVVIPLLLWPTQYDRWDPN